LPDTTTVSGPIPAKLTVASTVPTARNVVRSPATGQRVALGYVHRDHLEPGTEREAERLRVEHLLAAAGLVLRRAA